MRYAIPENGVLTHPVDIPQPWPEKFWTNDPLEFLAKMFPDHKGWILVADDNVSGAVKQQDGRFSNPAAEPVPQPSIPSTKDDIVAELNALIEKVKSL